MKRLPKIDEREYAGQWLALDPKTYEVLAHDRSLQKARAAARRRGVAWPLMHGVPASDGYFVGQSMSTDA